MMNIPKIDILDDFMIASYVIDRIYQNIDANSEHSFDELTANFLTFLLTSLINELKKGNTIIAISDNFVGVIDDILLTIYQLTDIHLIDINLIMDKNLDKASFLTYIDNEISACLKLSKISKIYAQKLTYFLKILYQILQYFDNQQIIYDYLQKFEKIFSKNNSPTPFIFKVIDDKIIVWLYRSYYAEYRLACRIFQLKNQSVINKKPSDINELIQKLNDLTSFKTNDAQNKAIKTALNSNFTIITGGPGTGKTFTVAKIVTLLVQYFGVASDKIALVAPTGKASQRMQESLQNSLHQDNILIQLPEAMTIHRLLRTKSANQKLAFDIIVVDEASMLGAELASALLSSIDDNTKLILLGDIHQLSAVEAGAVLADLCQIDKLADNLVTLTQSKRFNADSDVAKLAMLANKQLVNQQLANKQSNIITTQDIHAVIQHANNLSLTSLTNHLSDNRSNAISDSLSNHFANTDIYQKLSYPFLAFFEKLKYDWFHRKPSYFYQIKPLMDILNDYRILTATHYGKFGKNMINDRIKKSYFQFCIDNKLFIKKNSEWYHGRVVMITQNNYTLDLFNGDIGICLACKDGLFVFFDGKQTPFMVSVFDEKMVDTAYAMTIHKSQGSEFNRVAICLAGDDRLLGRELIYTAITRAKDFVDIYADSDTLAYAINKPVRRNTGLPIIFNHLDEKDTDIKYQNKRY